MEQRDFAFVCRDCRHTYSVSTDEPLEAEALRCPRCGSRHVRQRFWDYLRHGAATAPECSTSYG